MALLAGLSKIDWSRLHHAYGPATDVPMLLRALVDPDAASKELKARAAKEKKAVSALVQWELWGNVFHQGTRWQVTAKVVPFLAEILRDGPNDPDIRGFLLVYLHHLALGYPTDVFPTRANPEEWFASLVGVEDSGGEPDFEDPQVGDVWQRDAYLAVESHLHEFLEHFDSADEAVARAAIALASSFPRRAQLSLPRLRSVADGAGGHRAGAAILAAALLVGEEAQALAERGVASEEPIVAVHAACASVIANRDRASPQALSRLVTPLGDLATEGSEFAGTIGSMVGRCLALVGDEQVVAATDALARLHTTARPLEMVAVSHALLSLVFREVEPPADARRLTPLQRRALETIRDYGAFTVGSSGEFANYCLMMADWGLPSDRDSFARWLAQE